MFYEKYIDELVTPLNRPITQAASVQALIHVLDLLSFIVTQHTYRCKNYILREGLLSKAAAFLSRQEKGTSKLMIKTNLKRSQIGSDTVH
jgi:hypothetical protein